MKHNVIVELVERSGAVFTAVTRRKLGPPTAVLSIDTDKMTWFVSENREGFRQIFKDHYGDVENDLPWPFTTGMALKGSKGTVLSFDYFYTNVRVQVYGKAFWNLVGKQYQSFVFFKRILNAADMTREERSNEMIDIAAQELFWPALGGEAAALADPRALPAMAAIMALAACNPLGWLATAVAVMVGASVVAIDYELLKPEWQNYQNRVERARTEDELRDGAQSLANVWAKVIGDILAGIVLSKVGEKIPFERIKAAFNKKPSEWETAGGSAAPAPPARVQPWENKIDYHAQAIGRRVQGGPFCDSVGSFEQMSVPTLRAWLKERGYFKVRDATTQVRDGKTYQQASEIWYRNRPEIRARGKVEAVRIDEYGHVPRATPMAGDNAHIHTVEIDYAMSQEFLQGESIPELPVPYKVHVPPAADVPFPVKIGQTMQDVEKALGRPTTDLGAIGGRPRLPGRGKIDIAERNAPDAKGVPQKPVYTRVPDEEQVFVYEDKGLRITFKNRKVSELEWLKGPHRVSKYNAKTPYDPRAHNVQDPSDEGYYYPATHPPIKPR